MKEQKEVLLSVQHLKKYFHVGKNAILKAVDDVSFDIYKGETLGMVGESGCGKTTCGRTCIGLYDRTDGKVLYKGQDVHALDPKEKRSFKKEVQMVFQDPYASLHPRHSVDRVLSETLHLQGMDQIDRRITALLDSVGLGRGFRFRYPNQLSGGQQQRCAIGRALVKNPALLLCDEPTGALDYSTSKEILELIESVNRKYNNTIIIVTHNEAIKNMAHKILNLHDGKILMDYENESVIPARELEW